GRGASRSSSRSSLKPTRTKRAGGYLMPAAPKNGASRALAAGPYSATRSAIAGSSGAACRRAGAPHPAIATIASTSRRRGANLRAVADLGLDALDVPTSEALHLAAELEKAPNLRVVEDTEAVDDRDRTARHLHDVVGHELQIGLVGHGEDHGLDAVQAGGEVL